MKVSVRSWIEVKMLLQKPASTLVANGRMEGSSSSINSPPVPDSHLLHSSEANKEAGAPATARTQERSKEMMFGKDKASV
jgi:hypothetical protein